ncbi:MAG: signal recognition particle-docking protein FtsY [Alphaproteobacteria bacterium]
MRKSLARTAAALNSDVPLPRLTQQLDAADLQNLEERLISADLGPAFAARFVARLTKTSVAEKGEEHKEERLADALAEEILSVFTNLESELKAEIARESSVPSPPHPRATLLVGVNGSGKTTTAAKLAALHQGEGKKVLLVACDSFRAAASQQLEIWAERIACPVLPAPNGADPAALAFDGLRIAREEGFDHVLFDTAGRLHNRQPLMDELAKIARALAKQMPGAPHETLLVLDAASGQNAVRQAELFTATTPLNGIILTRLDGSARGGVAVALVDRFRLPVVFLGIGEEAADLVPFNPRAFVEGLVN